jgi:Flp pilus assembly protein TadB
LEVDTRALDELRAALTEQSRRSDRIVIGAALVISAVLWFGLRLYPRWFGLLIGVAGIAAWICARRKRSG